MSHGSVTEKDHVRQLTEAEAGYLAGIVDGEGCICIVSRKGDGRRSHQFGVEITVGNTSKPLMNWLVETTGIGTVSTSPQKRYENQKEVCSWRPGRRQARLLLPQIMPYMVIKKRQAEIVLRYYAIQDANRSGRLEDADMPEFLALYDEMRQLNQVGLGKPKPFGFSLGAIPARAPRLCQEDGCTVRTFRMEDYCYHHWLAKGDAHVKNCEKCGVEMTCINPRKRFCSEKCMWQSEYQRRKRMQCAEPDCKRVPYWAQPWCYAHWKAHQSEAAA